MAYIDTKYLFDCNTCRHHWSGKCDTWCDHGEEYRPDMSKIPIADVVEVVRCKNCKYNDCCWQQMDCGFQYNEVVFCSCGEPKTEDNHAHWEYWSGWCGNHDQRIEDATCSNCGYKHPTVRLDYVDGKFIKGYVPDKLAKECPNCGANMRGDNK